MEASGAKLVIEDLKLKGIKYLFGLSSTESLPLLDEVFLTPEISYVQSQHEQGAIYMANGYARATRRASVCLVGPGPGATNCQSGVAQAYYSSLPTVLIGVGNVYAR